MEVGREGQWGALQINEIQINTHCEKSMFDISKSVLTIILFILGNLKSQLVSSLVWNFTV
jgi:hypothetical protein